MKKKISIQCFSLRISSRRMIFVFTTLLFVSQSVLHAEIERDSFDFDGRLRNYMVYLPTNYTGTTNFPLVICLHPYGWGAERMMNYTNMNQVADASDFIVVYPSAIPNWNSGVADNPTYPTPNVDDVGFINALIDIMSNSYSIDLERIYACGYSNGGFMSYKLACQLSHRIAAIAPVGAVMSTSTAASCSPLRPVPVLHIFGTADPYVSDTGWYSVDQTLNYWINFNDCVQTDTTILPDLDPTDGCTVEKITYTDFSDNCNVVYYKVINGGHTWPGADPIPAFGKTNQDIDASVEIWNFFSIYDINGLILNPQVVDFNGDFKVDIDDLIIMIEYWGQDEPTCDVAPWPSGDGIVDRADLEVLMNFWGQEITMPPELIEWKLIVDDFEQYTDDPPNEIFTTWIDGSGDPTNGATVGHLFPEPGEHYVETTIVHNGTQSMPFFYDNTEAFISEATREWEDPQDWISKGFSELGLWFRGHPAAGSFTEGMDGTYTMTGSGADIWNNSDAFHFAYKQLSGAGSIIAKLESVDQTHDWAKAGVMIRETLDADSKHAMMIVTPARGVSFQRRTSTGGGSSGTNRAGITAPRWVKIERTASGSFIASYSGNGSSWTRLGSVNISMANTVYIGLALTSHTSSAMCEAVFSNVSIEGDISEETWTNQDIGITSNVAELMYVALNGNAAIYHDDPNAALIDDWTLWRIDLQEFSDQGVNLASVNLMTIGFGNRDNALAGGEGHVFFDYIGLR